MNNDNLKYTLIDHFELLSSNNKEVKDLYMLWTIIEQELTDKLSQSRHFFPFFSKHGVSHSKTIITNIGLFLGESRIKRLSPTDTFLLIFFAYVHDYGMAYDLEEICEVLEDKNGKLKAYIDDKKEYSKEARVLYNYYHEYKTKDNEAVTITLKDLYLALTIILSDFLRPEHAQGVEKMATDFRAFLRGKIKNRFIKAITKICELHCSNFDSILNELDYCCTGIFSDDCHPRFIATMIRIGDLLDLDNGRFSREFERTFIKDKNAIPEISKIHYLKHESISHLFVCEKTIEIEAKIETEHVGKYARYVANEVSNWLNSLEEECFYLNAHWGEIAQPDFGTPAKVSKKRIMIDDSEFIKQFHDLKMELPNDRIFSLLIGSNIYKDKYVAFREIIQNAIDATLLQVWKDTISGEISDNTKDRNDKLISSVSSRNTSVKHQVKEVTSKNSFIDQYKIQVNIITDEDDKSVFVEVIDNGTGIGEEDLEYMSKIGGNHMSNPGINELVKDMPPWFSPSSAFGIGLQSLFQLTNRIDFFTKKSNRTPRHIIFYSYSFNKGSIECFKCVDGKEHKDLFEKISSHGTMVRFKIDEKLFFKDNHLLNYDEEFDGKNKIYEHIGIEIIRVFKKYLANIKWNYFPIYFKNIPDKADRGYIQLVYPNYILYSVIKSENHFVYDFIKKSSHNSFLRFCYYNTSDNLFFDFIIPSAQIINTTDKDYIVSIPLIDDFFSLHYKYSYIENCDNLFQIYNLKEYPYKELLERNCSIMKLQVGIFNKDASKYLSIDRNTLKYNSLSYNMIMQNEKEAFTLLCERLIRDGVNRIHENNYATLVILFSRFVNKPLVDEFIKKYAIEGKKCLISIGKKSVDLQTLISSVVVNSLESYNNDVEFSCSELFSSFPFNLFYPYKIKYEKKDDKKIPNLKYSCKIRNESNDNCLVEMDKESKKYEIYTSLSENDSHRIDIQQLVRCIFRPWSDYNKIIVHKHPTSFSEKSHFNTMLEKNCYSYILSPFNDKMAKLISDNKDCDVNKLKILVTSKIRESRYFKKCVEYVTNNGIIKSSEDGIIEQYLAFINEVIEYVWNLYKEKD